MSEKKQGLMIQKAMEAKARAHKIGMDTESHDKMRKEAWKKLMEKFGQYVKKLK